MILDNEPPYNLVESLFKTLDKCASKTALIEPDTFSNRAKSRRWTFGELKKKITDNQRRLAELKVSEGDKVLVMLPINVEFYSLIAALMAVGAVPVFIDPSMPKKQFKLAIKLLSPKFVFSIPELLKLRPFLPSLWRSKAFTFQRGGFFYSSWFDLKKSDAPLEIARRDTHSSALISFTSGSTGTPKAANRTLEIVQEQTRISRELWKDHEDTVEMTGFPLVVFNNLIGGSTTVLPNVIWTALDKTNPKDLIEQIKTHKVNQLVLPPSLLSTILKDKTVFEVSPQIRSLISGGAPIPNWLSRKVNHVFNRSNNFIVYGSTEAEPISFISMKDAIKNGDKGYCVGSPIQNIEIFIAKRGDIEKRLKGEIGTIRSCSKNEPGEVLISGKHVVKEYFYNPIENNQTKIQMNSKLWHRTGDTGFLDEKNQIWLVGRLNNEIKIGSQVLDTYPIEHSLENQIENRVCLLSQKQIGKVLFYEGEKAPKTDLFLRKIEKLPVDKRHFWKIDRSRLN